MLKNITGNDRIKLFYLSLAACLIAASYAIFRPLKISIFFSLVGKEYYPLSKIVLIIFVLPCMIWYSKLVDRLKRHNVIYVLFTCYFIIGLIFTILLSHPTWGLTNTQTNHYRILGWLFSIFMDLFPTFVIGLFWSFVNSISTPQFAKNGYGIIVAFTKIGGIIAAGTSFLITYYLPQDTIPVQYFIVFALFLLLFSLPFISQIIAKIPKNELQGYQSTILTDKLKAPQKETFGNIGGLKFIFTKPYVFGIFALFYCYEVIFTIVEYQAIGSLSVKTNNNIMDMSTVLFLCMLISQVLGLFCALLGISTVLRRLKMQFALLIMPIVTVFLLIFMFAHPSLYVMLGVMTLLPTINFGFNAPIREMLFIPTTKEIQFKSKAWIDSFGRTISKTSGSTINMILYQSSITSFSFGNLFFSLIISGIWSTIAYFMGKNYIETITNKKIITGKSPIT